MAVYLLATLDTKGIEAEFLASQLRQTGVKVCVVDAGCLGQPQTVSDIRREEVFLAAGASLKEMIAKNDRGAAVTTAAEGATAMVRQVWKEGRLEGVIGIGGSAGTAIATAAMRALPVGVPKVMISTIASGQTRPYVADKDIFMLNSIVDIAGINRISRLVFSNAAAAMAGMIAKRPAQSVQDRPMIGATMFGVTTPCVQYARAKLEAAGYEVLVFHATGVGGQAFESLIREGMFVGVLDITTTELADELVGGALSAGPTRLTAAGEMGIPQVVSVGALDMVNFGPRESVPEKFAARKFYQHNPIVTLMRTTPAENRLLGAEIGQKIAASKGPACVFFPQRGVSAIDREGQPFEDREARQSLLAGIKAQAPTDKWIELDLHINDQAFAEAAADRLIAMLKEKAASR